MEMILRSKIPLNTNIQSMYCTEGGGEDMERLGLSVGLVFVNGVFLYGLYDLSIIN